MNCSHFDSIAERYDETIPKHIRNHYLDRRIKFITTHLKRGLSLDIGCGTGKLINNLSYKGFKTMGLDFSKEMLKIAAHNTKIELILGTTNKLPIRSNSFDLVTCIALLHHLVEPKILKETIHEMLRVAKPQGTVIIWDHNPNNPYWPIIMKRVPQDCGKERLIPLKEILSILQTTNLLDTCIYRKGFMPDFVPQCLLFLFRILEQIVEKTPLLNWICAHNVIVVRK